MVKLLPTHSYYHRQRLKIAKNLSQTEPLQGAMADYFFACWYDMDSYGKLFLQEVADILPKYVTDAFLCYVGTGEYMPQIATLATRYSVLITPSMNAPHHKRYVGKDDAKQIAQVVSSDLLHAKNNDDHIAIAQIQSEYFEHCLACKDKMGFMVTWFTLAKEGWEFDDAWLNCKTKLEEP